MDVHLHLYFYKYVHIYIRQMMVYSPIKYATETLQSAEISTYGVDVDIVAISFASVFHTQLSATWCVHLTAQYRNFK